MEMVTCIKQTKISEETNMHNRLIWGRPITPYLSCTDMWVECDAHTVCTETRHRNKQSSVVSAGNELIGFYTNV